MMMIRLEYYSHGGVAILSLLKNILCFLLVDLFLFALCGMVMAIILPSIFM